MLSRAMSDVDYPKSDGRPMAETDTHRDQMIDLIRTLQRWFRGRDDVYVSGNLLLYYVEGDKRRHVSPDVFIVRGIPSHKRDYYLLWQEGQPPHMVIEITSSSTRHVDMVRKKALYAELGVREYFIFDPRRDYLQPQLQGWRLRDGRWIPIPGRHLRSKVAELDLEIVDDVLRLIEPSTGRMLPTTEEFADGAQARAHEADAQAEEARAQAEEAQAQAEEARAQAEEAQARVCDAEARADEAQSDLAEERRKRLEAEAELRRLRGG